MKYLITGGAGFIGTNFIYYMLENHPEYEYVCLDKLTYAGNLANLRKALEYKNFRFIKGDIADRKFVFDLFEQERFDVVVNFAAESHVDRSIETPDVFLVTNVLGAQVLLDASRKFGVKRFHSTRGHPYFVQMLSYEVWNRTEWNATMEDVENAIDYLCDRESYGYDLIIEALDYKYLKNVLKLIGQNDGGYFSNSNLLAYKIPGAGALNRLLKRLTEQGIIEKTGRGKYQIIDPLFERYVNKVLV